jgi:lipopolysaccharide biosynthesis protein
MKLPYILVFQSKEMTFPPQVQSLNLHLNRKMNPNSDFSYWNQQKRSQVFTEKLVLKLYVVTHIPEDLGLENVSDLFPL